VPILRRFVLAATLTAALLGCSRQASTPVPPTPAVESAPGINGTLSLQAGADLAQPALGVRVEVRDLADALITAVTTDPGGRWHADVGAGQYHVRGVVPSSLLCPLSTVEVSDGGATSGIALECFGK
jgi:hypothetical protein